jgi:hypothetical protein
MKKTLIKNILVAVIPTLIYFGSYFLFMSLYTNPIRSSFQVTPLLINILIPAIIGAVGLFVAAYSYVNRNSLLFIFLFIGSFLASVSYSLTMLNILIPLKVVRMTITPQMTFVIVGLYVGCFWMSLISKIKNR